MTPEDTGSQAPKNTRRMPLREDVARRAEELWKKSGAPSGRDEEFWLEAERQLIGADPEVRVEGDSAVSAKLYSEATDANHAKQNR